MNVLEYFKPVTTFVFDVDGVLTDGTLLVMPDGLMARRMNIKDGYALQRLIKLGVNEVFMGIKDKLYCLKEYLSKNSLQQEEVMFMGDDIPDYEVMLNVGLPCCPIDAVSEIKSISKYISPFKGGEGCGRDVIEKVLKLRGTWSIDTKIKSQ
jgi:3-deoxy-D-manno-octulosonate 8-phosphate phosphatase (KDO 8-P phosphatase)